MTRAEEIIKASVTLLSKLPLALPELVSNYIMYLQPKKQVKHFGSVAVGLIVWRIPNSIFQRLFC